MLPFLAKKKDSGSSGLLVQNRAPDQQPDQDDPDAAKQACGQAILSAIQSNDPAGIVSAIQDCMALGDQPDESSEMPDEGSI